MLAIVFGLGAAAAYGAADFVGGVMSRRVPSTTVVLLSQLLAVPLVLISLPLGGGTPSLEAVGWGAGAGMAGGFGVLFLYRGLAIGRMNVVAPITALAAAGLPVLYGVATGERPAPLAVAGLFLALLSVWLISVTTRGEEATGTSSGIVDALIAGTGFGVFFILLDGAPDSSGLWPLLGTRAGSLVLVGLLMLVRRERLQARRPDLVGIGAAGTLDVTANVLYVLSAREGLLAIAAVLTSLYPAGTILLARVILKERLTPIQGLGLVAGGLAVAFIALA